MSSSPLLGRDRDLDALERLARAAAGGSGAIALIEGEAGIGRTRLVGEALARADDWGLAAVAAAAEELDQRRPFGVLTACLGIRLDADRRRAAVAERLVGQPSGGRAGLRPEETDGGLWVGESILALVEELSAAAPMLMVIEDLQWADAASLPVLQRLGRRVGERPILLVCTCRSGRRPRAVERLLAGLAAAGAHRIALEGLDEAAVAELATALAGAPPGPELLRLLSGACGNPFYVTELIGALAGRGAIAGDAGGTAELAAPAMPPALVAAILQQLGSLPEDALELLRIGAVMGPAFTAAELAKVTARPALTMVPALQACMGAGILSERGQRLGFRHELVRGALYEDLPRSLRRQLHRDVGLALAGGGARPERVAEHLARGASPGDAEAVAWLRRAALDAASRAPAVACELLERALELSSDSEPERDAIRADWALSLFWSGRVAEAEAAAGAAIEGSCDAATEGRLRLCRVQALLALGRPEDALQEAERAADAALPTADRARARAWEALGALLAGASARPSAAPRLALTAAEEAGDAAATVVALRALSLESQRRGDPAAGLAHAERAVAVADRAAGVAAHRLGLHLTRGALLVELDRLEAAGQAFREGLAAAEASGSRPIVPLCQLGAAAVRFLAGAWDDAAPELAQAVALGEELGLGWLAGAYALEAVIAFHRGDRAFAERRAADAERALAPATADPGAAWAARARALLLEEEGLPGAALEALAGAWERSLTVGAASDGWVVGPQLVRAALAEGDRKLAVTAAQRLEALAAAAPGVPTAVGAALRARGLVDDDPYLLLRSVAVHRAGPRPLELALACEDAAAALERAHGGEAARQLLGAALAVYERLGASREVSRLDAGLRAAGVRRGRRGRRDRPHSGWGALTPTERQVVELVAEGMSNPEIARRLFLSRHTVQTHVSHALAKLGVRSRVELAAEAVRHRPA